ncbi:MAG: FtsX-like permease family protein [bacterium]|nr:FtsX-like permease family protein [bacterium]
MRVGDILLYAREALVGHRLRTSLTVAGLTVGIAAVIVLTALGEGARLYVMDEFASLGSNLLIVLPGKVETTGAMPFGGVTHDLTVDDVRAIQNRLTGVLRAAPVSMGTETVRYEGLGRSAAILGTSADLQQVQRLELAAGRFLSQRDVDAGGSEVVLGSKIAAELFGTTNALGEIVRIGEWRFRVVGILTPRGRALGMFDLDDLVMVPVRTGMSMFNRSSLFRIFVEVRTPGEMDMTKKRVTDLLAERHRAEDVTVISQDALASSFSAILQAMTLALGGIASVSLAVAGVGIMNVMLVSVTERRAEIGLLKALGATSREILWTFLAEAVLLSSFGGFVGLCVGYGAVWLIVSAYPAFPATPPLWAVIAALVLSLGVGVGFGIWPARRATQLDPVSALARR